MQKNTWLTAISVLTAVLTSSSVRAVTIAEIDDAGELLNAAQVISSGTTPLDLISGTLSGDADLFQIFLTGGQTFSATTISLDTLIGIPVDNLLDNPTELLDDPQLFLFDSSGQGVYANDDSFGSLQSTLPSGGLSPNESGIYYLAISSFGYNPVSASGQIFPNQPADGVFGPTGSGGSGSISGFVGTSTTSGSYTIALTGVQTNVQNVPEPALVLGMLALGFWGSVFQLKKNT